MKISWIEPNILAASGIPLDAKDLRSLHSQGIRAMLSLTEHSLLTFTEITPALLTELGMAYAHVPIPDQHPPTFEQAARILQLIEAMKQQQRPLFVHCHAGVGRTGTILHLYYLSQGFDWDKTKAKIRATRVQCLLLADEQRAFLRAYIEANANGS
jgi:atypical dual specificity phosphatase